MLSTRTVAAMALQVFDQMWIAMKLFSEAQAGGFLQTPAYKDTAAYMAIQQAKSQLVYQGAQVIERYFNPISTILCYNLFPCIGSV